MEEQLKKQLEQLEKSNGELSDEELDQISGGIAEEDELLCRSTCSHLGNAVPERDPDDPWIISW